MTIQEFIDFYSRAYRSFGLFSEIILRNNAEYLEGFADGRGDDIERNEKILAISNNLREVAHMIATLQCKA